jgi:hypothetical protein
MISGLELRMECSVCNKFVYVVDPPSGQAPPPGHVELSCGHFRTNKRLHDMECYGYIENGEFHAITEKQADTVLAAKIDEFAGLGRP